MEQTKLTITPAEPPAPEPETPPAETPTKAEVLKQATDAQEQLAATVFKPRQDGPRRGRKPGSKNIPKDKDGKPIKQAPDLSPEKRLEMTGRMIEGSFMMLSAGLGPHWTLPPDEVQALARVWQPVLDYYDVQPGIGLLIYNATALSIGIIGPRVQVTIQRKTGLFGKLSEWWRRRKHKAA